MNHPALARTETRAPYLVTPNGSTDGSADDEDATIAAALAILDRRARKPGAELISVQAPTDYCRLMLADYNQNHQEAFGTLFLDCRNRLIAAHVLSVGTLTQTSVYPREVVKAALSLGAAAVIFTHNHPSGVADPSYADESLTRALKEALALVDVRTLDHIIVGDASCMSMAQRGLI